MTITDGTGMKYTDISDTPFCKNFVSSLSKEGYDPEWFGHLYENEDGIRFITFKDEYFAEVNRATNKLLEAQNLKAAKEIDTNLPTLPKEQWDYLSNKYNPKNMTKQQYIDFIEELVQLGIISAQEKRYLLFQEISASAYIVTAIPETYMEAPFVFENCKGNVCELARFHSEMEFRRLDSYSYYHSAQSLSFEKLNKVFTKMGVR